MEQQLSTDCTSAQVAVEEQDIHHLLAGLQVAREVVRSLS
jgi:hypothetical protein